MILPILISVSLAPGSYFFCALAWVAIAAATAKTVKAIKLRARTGIVLSRLTNYFFEVLQVVRTLASAAYSAARNNLVVGHARCDWQRSYKEAPAVTCPPFWAATRSRSSCLRQRQARTPWLAHTPPPPRVPPGAGWRAGSLRASRHMRRPCGEAL